MSHSDTDRLLAERIAVETVYRAFNDKNPDLLDKAVSTDWQDIPLAPGQGPGAAGFKPILLGFIEALPDVNIEIHEMIQLPGRIAVRAEITGTHLGNFMGIAATGKKVSFAIHEFHHLDKGRITTTWHLEDWFGLFRQLEQFPAG
ncbi:ester cyclase [Pantoea sp. BAV 3049]|uniref:ester cyclase n=1 Tax=Pantoea sp. BAV 3049 TaxID=2654188 RepID=UPI00131E869E|nr:ester cyclase [Pantoea sp. BAV 3049]